MGAVAAAAVGAEAATGMSAGELIGNIALNGRGGGGQSQGGGIGMTAPVDALTASLAKLNSVVDHLLGPTDELTKLFNKMAGFVKQFSPADFIYYQRAVADFSASIGEFLVPVLKFGTELFRFLGDAVATFTSKVSGSMELLFSTLGKAIESLWPVVSKLIGEMAVVFNVLLAVITPFIPMMSVLARMFADIIGGLIPLLMATIGPVLAALVPLIALLATSLMLLLAPFALLGKLVMWIGKQMGLLGNGQDRTSTGKAFIQASTDSVTGMLTKAQTTAFGIGPVGPEQKSANYLEMIYKFMTGKWGGPAAEAYKNSQYAASGADDALRTTRAGRIALDYTPQGWTQQGLAWISDRIEANSK